MIEKRRYYLLSMIILLIVLVSCSSDKNPFGLKELSQNALLNVRHLVRTGTVQEVSIQYPDVDSRTSDELLLGKYRGDESAALLKFGGIAEKIDSATVKKVYLFLTPWYKLKDTEANPVDVSIHKVTMSWDEETINPPDVLTNYEVLPLSTGQIPASVNELDTLFLTIDLVQDWIDNPAANNGILLLGNSADHLTVYYSDETTYLPQLKVVFERKGAMDSLKIDASEALSVIQTDYQLPADRLVVGSGIGYSSFFQLDISPMPKYATINRAFLELQVDTTQTIHAANRAFEMIKFKANTLDWQTFPELADSATYDTSRYWGGSRIKINITDKIQKWVNRETENNGFRLSALYTGKGLYRTVFYTSADPDSMKRPRLEVFYTIPF